MSNVKTQNKSKKNMGTVLNMEGNMKLSHAGSNLSLDTIIFHHANEDIGDSAIQIFFRGTTQRIQKAIHTMQFFTILYRYSRDGRDRQGR